MRHYNEDMCAEERGHLFLIASEKTHSESVVT